MLLTPADLELVHHGKLISSSCPLQHPELSPKHISNLLPPSPKSAFWFKTRRQSCLNFLIWFFSLTIYASQYLNSKPKWIIKIFIPWLIKFLNNKHGGRAHSATESRCVFSPLWATVPASLRTGSSTVCSESSKHHLNATHIWGIPATGSHRVSFRSGTHGQPLLPQRDLHALRMAWPSLVSPDQIVDLSQCQNIRAEVATSKQPS